MSAVVVTPRMAFEARIERRAGTLTLADRAAIEALYKAWDSLQLRRLCALNGMRMVKRCTVVGGKKHYFLTRAA